jgi:dihydropyrimidine dehydrogenase (NAD+) subunit PreA
MGIGIQNMEQISDRSLADNLANISWLKSHYPHQILGVSVMGFTNDGWATLARAAQDNGADWIELNFSCPHLIHNDAVGHEVGQNIDLIEQFTAAAKSNCSIPLVAKMTPNLADMVPAALAAQQGGADAISAINTFKSISHVHFDYLKDHQHYQPQPNVQGFSSISGFSGPACRPMALRFIADLALDPRLTIPISGMGGLYTWRDAVEFLSLGASNLQCSTAVMHHGVEIIDDLKDGLLRHLRRLGHDSVNDIVGASLPYLTTPQKLDLHTEAVSAIDPELCIGCGVCVRSCRDGAVAAIDMGQDGKAQVNPDKCVGCLLCQHVCPVEGAVQISTRPRIKSHQQSSS